ncbi:MAG: hypothetical protein SWX82_17730 [Cyanobacteriota bacterium]|nr:hypothetical protein [Cyanobacteriota bacterium]
MNFFETLNKESFSWVLNGSPTPMPHSLKILTIMQYLAASKYEVFIETGTLRGDTVEAISQFFDCKIYTIELSDELYEKATLKFKSNPNIECIHGDSGEEITKLLSEINVPCFFWLDAHFSGGITAKGKYTTTPIMAELLAIINHPIKNHLVLVDDIRNFEDPQKTHYPDPQVLIQMLRCYLPNIKITYFNDIMRIIPKEIKVSSNFNLSNLLEKTLSK